MFNPFIVIPLLIERLTWPLFYEALIAGNPANVRRLAGALLGSAAVACSFVTVRRAAANQPAVSPRNPEAKPKDKS